MRTRLALIVVLLLAIACPASQHPERKKPVLHEAVGLLRLLDWSGDPDPVDIGEVGVYPRDVSAAAWPRLVLIDSTTNTFGIPTFRDGVGDVASSLPNVPLLLDSGGYLAFKPVGATRDQWIDVGPDPETFEWPQVGASTNTGCVIGISDSTASPPTLGTFKAPVCVATVASVDLNTTSKTNLFTPASGETWIVDYVIVEDPSTSLTIAVFSLGSNAAADDWQTGDLYEQLTGSTKFQTVYPMDGATVTTDSTPFGVKCLTPQGGAATATFEVYGHKVG